MNSLLKFKSIVPTLNRRLCRRQIFISSEATPNPHSMKFLPGKEVLPENFGTGMYIQSSDIRDIQRSSLAKSLFSIKGVKGIFLGRDFITVTKNTDDSWTYLKNLIYSEIFDFYGKELPIIVNNDDSTHKSDTFINENDDEIVATIKELLETRIRPSVQEDGGDIFYVGFIASTGIVQVRLAGSCVGCPSSSITLRNGVENMLKHYIPEVKGIEEIPQIDVNEEDNKLSFNPETVVIDSNESKAKNSTAS